MGETQATAHGIALHRTAELAEWDDEALALPLSSLKEAGELGDVGVDDGEIDAPLPESQDLDAGRRGGAPLRGAPPKSGSARSGVSGTLGQVSTGLGQVQTLQWTHDLDKADRLTRGKDQGRWQPCRGVPDSRGARLGDLQVVYLDHKGIAISDWVVWRNREWGFAQPGPSRTYADTCSRFSEFAGLLRPA